MVITISTVTFKNITYNVCVLKLIDNLMSNAGCVKTQPRYVYYNYK